MEQTNESTNGQVVAEPEGLDDGTHVEPGSEAKPLKGISLWQPWASLIAYGAKKIETRSWPTDYRGPIAILATATIKPEGREAASNPAIVESLEGVTIDALPLGCVVAVAELVGCLQCLDAAAAETPEPERHFGNFAEGRWAWFLENVRAMPEPIPCAGAQKIFDLPEDVAAKVWAAMAPPVRKPLEWIDDGDDWMAESWLKVPRTDNGEPESTWWYVSKLDEQESGPPCFTVDGCFEMEPEPGKGFPEEFPTLEAAQAWCEARDAELWAKAHHPDCDAPAVTVEQSVAENRERVGSRTDTPIDEVPIDLTQWKLIQAARRDEKRYEDRVNDLKEQLKAAKEDHESASRRLGSLIDDAERCETEPMLPFKEARAEQKTADQAATSEAASNAEKQGGATPADESWKLVSLEELGIKGRALKALAEHTPPLTNHGELSDWQEKKGDFWAKDIAGLGPKGREEIEECQFTYFSAHPECGGPPKQTLQENANEPSRNHDGQQVAGTVAELDKLDKSLAGMAGSADHGNKAAVAEAGVA